MVVTGRKRTRGAAAAADKRLKDHSNNMLFKATLQEHMQALAAAGMTLTQHEAVELRLRTIADHVIRSLSEYGWAVVDNFVGRTNCRHTHNEIERLYKRGLFSDGRVVDGSEPNPKDVRSDETYWFDAVDQRAEDCGTVRHLIRMIDAVVGRFRDKVPPYKISGRTRAMLAIYPGNGSRYVKHVDNPVRDGRCFTTVYYCNENWKLDEDGGALRLYPETSEVPMDIDPQADRLVFFWSDHRNPHEVRPAFRNRYAITIWYFDDGEKARATERQKAQSDGALNVSSSSASSEVASQGSSNSLENLTRDKAPLVKPKEWRESTGSKSAPSNRSLHLKNAPHFEVGLRRSASSSSLGTNSATDEQSSNSGGGDRAEKLLDAGEELAPISANDSYII
ncbi:CRE-EGL-9 protein [Aphelenchoides avenae]|nr:CRE-EGL-9 protein [Aphelenchus avenae]